MCQRWRTELRSTTDNMLDVRAWMHHTALAMFVACMMGDDRAFSPVVEDPLALHIEMYADYEDDKDFIDTTPINSLPARSVFNLESTGKPSSPDVMQAKFMKALGYVGKLTNRGEERQEEGKVVGPLMERIMVLEQEEKISNTLATLVAGHDTTAYTMQFCLMELARHQDMQQRVRDECTSILDAIDQEGRSLSYSDMSRFELLTKCLSETLRMWNVASIVFPRITSFDDALIGKDGTMAKIPSGTKFTFWYYGQHHSKECRLWGAQELFIYFLVFTFLYSDLYFFFYVLIYLVMYDSMG